jgi:hypothetical protein
MSDELLNTLKLFKEPPDTSGIYRSPLSNPSDWGENIFDFKYDEIRFCCIVFDKDDFEENKFVIGHERIWGITKFLEKLEEMGMKDDFQFILEEKLLTDV